MNTLVAVERALLGNLARNYEQFKSIDDKTMRGKKNRFVILFSNRPII